MALRKADGSAPSARQTGARRNSHVVVFRSRARSYNLRALLPRAPILSQMVWTRSLHLELCSSMTRSAACSSERGGERPLMTTAARHAAYRRRASQLDAAEARARPEDWISKRPLTGRQLSSPCFRKPKPANYSRPACLPYAWGSKLSILVGRRTLTAPNQGSSAADFRRAAQR